MKDTYKLYIGIDPGKSGGVAMINKKDNALTVMKFPNELGELSVMIEAFIHNVKVDDVCVTIGPDELCWPMEFFIASVAIECLVYFLFFFWFCWVCYRWGTW